MKGDNNKITVLYNDGLKSNIAVNEGLRLDEDDNK